jgi:hypothetical protein
MDIAVFDLQQLQHFFENLDDPEFLDAGFCEGLPEDQEPHAAHYGKNFYTDLYRPSEHLLACIRYALLEKRSIVEAYKLIDISNLGAPSVVFTYLQIQGLLRIYLKLRYSIEARDLLGLKFNFAEDHPLTLAFGKERTFRGPGGISAAITTQCAPFEETCFLETEQDLYSRLRHVKK